ncbi:methyltransferase domain-containing protein [Dactylosporangium sp. CA-092794]|uniref:class I SAM-dependent methyltransferase n=1 Tax=Dactylosporangium sp. CA-092794 TaxID=3239929 RepID=UPI003D903F85
MTGTINATRCPLCGPEAACDPALGGVLRRCRSCGLRWTAGAAPDPATLYDEDYFAGGGNADYFHPRPRRFEAGRRVRWLRSLSRRGRIAAPESLLEAGSAGGFFVEAARSAGIRATGVEVSAAAVRYAEAQLRVPVRHGTFESVAPALPPVDAVCAFHVLEHVEDPLRFLAAAGAVLRPGGWLALEVPNIASAAAQRLGLDWPALQPRYHRWHFTPETLTALLAGCGFRVVHRDTAVFRYYMPVPYRLRHLHRLLPADLRDLRSARLTHPRRGDLLRIVAQRAGRRRTDTNPGGNR